MPLAKVIHVHSEFSMLGEEFTSSASNFILGFNEPLILHYSSGGYEAQRATFSDLRNLPQGEISSSAMFSQIRTGERNFLSRQGWGKSGEWEQVDKLVGFGAEVPTTKASRYYLMSARGTRAAPGMSGISSYFSGVGFWQRLKPMLSTPSPLRF